YLRDGAPQAGLEKAFDRDLEGKNGRTIGMVDKGGDFLPLRTDPDSTAKQDGKDIRLTIDSEIQLVAAAAVRTAVESNKADQGCAIVIEPETGNILAMANWPSFDPDRIGEPLKGGAKFSDANCSYMAVLEPGSTFKILTLALALDKQRVNFAEQIDCKGSLQVWPTKAIRCDAHGGRRAHGYIGPVDAIAKSCNVSAAAWAQRVGFEDFTQFLAESGLLEKTGIGLPAEAAGRYNTEEYAKGLQLATFGFGQSLTTSPLALCSAFSMLGNGGVRVKPRLIERIGDRALPVKPGGRLVSEETAASVMLAMEQVFESDHGTGHSLRIPGYRLAGKTGTAQKINPQTGTVEGGGYVSNFVGYVPAEKPKATILVMIDNPKMGKYYGATVAGPVFQDVAKAVIRRMSIPPSAPRNEGPLVEIQSAKGPEVQVTRRP
ncbi:MAG TPA: penicillin-binding protein 2, partial [Fimbriimonadaceae bacterium]|nr:penicillin-binding protein 2 [Fimbriimonadaceae bacterium]